eukprot:8072400-Pyramimonas_sp.AAC.1
MAQARSSSVVSSNAALCDDRVVGVGVASKARAQMASRLMAAYAAACALACAWSFLCRDGFDRERGLN